MDTRVDGQRYVLLRRLRGIDAPWTAWSRTTELVGPSTHRLNAFALWLSSRADRENPTGGGRR
jgi:hypothetical protein